MSPRSFRAPALVVALCAACFVPGCGKSTPPTQPAAINSTQANDVAVQVGALMSSGGSPAPVPGSLLSGDGSMLAAIRRPSPSASAAETTVTSDGVTWTLAIHWYDALDVEQLGYHPLTTVRMLADSRGTGTLTAPHANMTVATSGHLDIRGISSLQDTTLTSATEHDTLSYSGRDANGSASVLAYCSGAFVNLVEAKPASAHHPERGTASWSMEVTKHLVTGSGSFDQHFVATAMVTFNGTNLVPLVVNGIWHFTLDLDTGEVTPVVG